MASAALAVYEKHAHELEPQRDQPVPPDERMAGWVGVMKGAISKNASFFNRHRMMQRYTTEAYVH